MKTNKYLMDEIPLLVFPSLAHAIGLNESIIIQQMNYWITKSDKLQTGRVWTYNSYEAWRDQFPFWSQRTIQRIILELEKKGILISQKMNNAKWDHTKWYTINYEVLKQKTDEHDAKLALSRLPHADVVDHANLTRSLKTDTSSDTSSDNAAIADLGKYHPSLKERGEDAIKKNEDQNKSKKKEKHIISPSEVTIFRDAWQSAVEKRTGIKPSWSAKLAAQTSRLIKSFGLERSKTALQAWMKDDWGQKSNYGIGTLIDAFPRLWEKINGKSIGQIAMDKLKADEKRISDEAEEMKRLSEKRFQEMESQ